MSISVQQPQQDTNLIALDGRLDVAGVQAVESQFNAEVAAKKFAIVDLSKVPFIASLGIRLLVAAAQGRTKQGGKMVLMNFDEMTLKILKTTGIDQVIPVCKGLEEAKAALK